MTSEHTNAPLYVSAEGKRRPMYRSEVISRRLVYFMFSLAILSFLIASFAVITDRPLAGTPQDAPVVFQRVLTLSGDGTAVTVVGEEGQVLLDAENGGFIAVVIDGLERARLVARVEGNPPVTVTQFENGRLSLHDAASGWTTELGSFGPGNLGVWQKLVTP